MKAVVVGSVNCMGSEYAIFLKKYCEEVIHYYEYEKGDLLNNPRKRWGSESAVLTSGLILKKTTFKHMIFFLFPRLFQRRILRDASNANIVLLTGEAISLANSIEVPGKTVIAIGYGNDISLLCNPDWPEIAEKKRCGFKRVFNKIIRKIQAHFVNMQIAGLRKCTHYSYFVEGFDPQIDELLLNVLKSDRDNRLPRYSVNLSTFSMFSGRPSLISFESEYTILFPVRFSPADKLFGDKGWRLLFEGLKKYELVAGKKFKCICFKKGDFKAAQDYARELDLERFLEWHEIVDFEKLVQYYKSADVVIEQLGTHWIGQGLWTMALGKPLIAKFGSVAQVDYFRDSGVLEVKDSDSLALQLKLCEEEKLRADIGNKSKHFVEKHASTELEFINWGVLQALKTD